MKYLFDVLMNAIRTITPYLKDAFRDKIRILIDSVKYIAVILSIFYLAITLPILIRHLMK